jgi:hypothetical protein
MDVYAANCTLLAGIGVDVGDPNTDWCAAAAAAVAAAAAAATAMTTTTTTTTAATTAATTAGLRTIHCAWEQAGGRSEGGGRVVDCLPLAAPPPHSSRQSDQKNTRTHSSGAGQGE